MHTITSKLNKDARQFQAGESTGFGISLGVKYRDRKTGQDEWTNYSAVIFAKSPNQISFYQSVLVAGSIVSVSCEQLKVESFDGQNGQMITLDMINARLTFANNPNQSSAQPQQGYNQAPQQRQQPAQQGYQPRQAPQQGSGGYDDDMPI